MYKPVFKTAVTVSFLICILVIPTISLAKSTLYSPLLKNVGTTVCTAINVGAQAVRFSVQIVGHNEAFEGPIIGDKITRPGGWWYTIIHNSTAEFTRGVIRVSGNTPEMIRANCWTSTSEHDPAYFQADAKPLRISSTPRGANP